MARTVTTLTIFLSCPSELDADRRVVSRVVDVVNKAIKSSHNVQYELWHWNESVIPGVGNTAQEVIDRQIPEHDIYLGMMWKRFGTPTGSAGSGTEHEFRNSLASYKDKKNPRHIIFAFKTSISSLDEIDPLQFAKVGDFRTSLQKEGVLFTTFGSDTELEKLLHINLTSIALTWLTSQPADQSSTTNDQATSSMETDISDASDELGLLDYMEQFEEQMNSSTSAMTQIGSALAEMSNSISQRAEEMNDAKLQEGSLRMNLARQLSNKAADDMNRFTMLATPLIHTVDTCFENGIETITKAITIQKSISDISDEEINGLDISLAQLMESTAEADDKMGSMREAVLGLPKLSARFNRARRDLLGFLDSYNRLSTKLKSLTMNVRQSLKQMKEP